jgi:hypothetical protein
MPRVQLPALLPFSAIALVLVACTSTEEEQPADAGEVVVVPPRPTSWHDVDITATVGGPRAQFLPMEYTRHDGNAAILWQGSLAPGQDGIYEAAETAGTWHRSDLVGGADPKNRPWAGAFGYLRADGTDSVLYVAPIGKQRHTKELTWNSGEKRWQEWDLTATGKGQPIDSTPVAYVRGDRTSAVVFCQFNGDLREVWMSPTGWHEASLRQAAGGAEAANCDQCRPAPVATANGQSVVVYLGVDNHVHAVMLAGGAWSHHDLTQESRSKFSAYPCPTAYQRSDGTVSVLYKVPVNGGFGLREMTGNYQAASKNYTWADWDLLQSTSPPPPLVQDCSGALCNAGDAYGYVTPNDNVSHVVYPGRDAKIEHISLQGGRWLRTLPSPSDAACAGPALFPRPYLHKDGSPAVVYLGPDWSIHELRLY